LCVVNGVLYLGEAFAVLVIRTALAEGLIGEEHTIINGPPGNGCPVLESVSASDYCVMVAKPTAFSLHNPQMVVEMVILLEKPCGIIINKMKDPYEPLENICRQSDIPVLCRIPYSETLSRLNAAAQIACEQDESSRTLFDTLLKRIEAEAKR
jgi:MinD superfamily P-loop ATPase